MPLTARRHALRLLATLPALALPGLAVAAGPQMRIGTLAPKNSLYHRQLLEIGEAWRAAQGEGAKFTV
mgnify:FL=1